VEKIGLPQIYVITCTVLAFESMIGYTPNSKATVHDSHFHNIHVATSVKNTVIIPAVGHVTHMRVLKLHRVIENLNTIRLSLK
jgi:hypothetical protein